MFKSLLLWLTVFPLVLVLVVFSISNRGIVAVQVSLSHALELPLYAIFWAGLFIGFLSGWIACWLNGSKKRKRLSQLENENTAYQTKLSDVMNEQTQLKARVLDATDKNG